MKELWAFEHSGLIRDWVSIYVHSAERTYFYRVSECRIPNAVDF